jgi:hypothetical protein
VMRFYPYTSFSQNAVVRCGEYSGLPYGTCSTIQTIEIWNLHDLSSESASSPLVGFGELNDNTIKGLTTLLSVEQKIEFIAYTYGLWNEKCI